MRLDRLSGLGGRAGRLVTGVILGCALLLAGCTSAIVLGVPDDGAKFSARVGQIVEIRLAETASTGFIWQPDLSDHDSAELVDSQTQYSNLVPGASGQAIFRFRVLRSGTIRLKNVRPWEQDQSAALRYTVTVDASP